MFGAATNKYKSSLQFLGKKKHRWITVAIIALSALIFTGISKIVPRDFVPNEDSGVILGMMTLSPGTSLEKTDTLVKKIAHIAQNMPSVKNVLEITGVNFMSGVGSSYATVMLKMDPWNERKVTANDIAAQLKQATDTIKDASFFFMGMPTLQGFGMASGVSVQLQDRTGGDIGKFSDVANKFVEDLKKTGNVMMVMNTFDGNFPQKEIIADIPKIKEAGMTLGNVMQTLQAYVGSMYVSNFNLYGKQFRVMVQAGPEYRKSMNDISGIYVKTGSGEMAPITEFITIKDITGPQSLSRFNMYSSMSLTIIPNYMKGKSTGDVIKSVDELSKALPSGYSHEYSGISREEVESGNQTVLIFALSLIFVYLLLAALYESYILPLAVIFSLPVGLAGVFIFVFIAMMSGTGIMNNIYVQISLIMLIGLLAKNAILIVEYAIQRRQQGMSIIDAAVNGAVARLRPILMTSFAFIAGLIPLALASGAGAVGNKSIGISAIGGMLFGTMIGVLVIPSLYIIFQTLQDKFSKSGLINSNDEVINKQKK
ncbi:MAG: hypothetical protein BGN96_04795 [Bacteroidales bacterium 45-6]|nr:MAG: hypothetical protein BGN96_04795 [Bacteroidales bacterium 45-6]